MRALRSIAGWLLVAGALSVLAAQAGGFLGSGPVDGPVVPPLNPPGRIGPL